jgi:hypothetical protein
MSWVTTTPDNSDAGGLALPSWKMLVLMVLMVLMRLLPGGETASPLFGGMRRRQYNFVIKGKNHCMIAEV